MKKVITILNIFCLVSLNLFAQKLPDDIQNNFEKYRNGNNLSYDRGAKFLLDKSTQDYYNGTTITDKYRTSYVYNKQGYEVSALTEIYNSSTMTWNENTKTTSTYDANNNRTSLTKQTFDAVKNSWFTSIKTYYTYNPDNTQKTYKYYSYDAKQPDSTTIEIEVTSTYDANKVLIEDNQNTLYKLTTPYSLYKTKSIYEYNSEGKKIATRFYDTKVTPEQYTDIFKYTYDSKNNEIKSEEYYINSLGSENLDVYNNKTYNAKNQLTIDERISVNAGKIYKYEYKYDTDNNLSETKYYNVPVSSYKLKYISTYTYKQFVKNQDLEVIEFSISPNPVKNLLQLEATNPIDAISIFNIDGKICMTQTNPDKFIDLSQIETGIYFIQIYTKEGIGTKKLIKE